VNVVYERFALGGVPFTVQILLNDKLVGSVYNFSSTPKALGAVDGCENCLRQQQSKILSSGQITLTGALLASIDDAGIPLDTLDKDVVRPYLQTHLKHRVVIAGGTEIPLSRIPSLQVSVAVGGRIAKIRKDARSAPQAGMPMSQLPVGDSSESEGDPAVGTWKPVVGHVKYGEIFDEEGTIYDTIEITPHTRDRSGGEGPVKLALMGYTDYQEVLSL